jgi:hypothetical protein
MLSLLYLSEGEGQFRVRLGLEMVSHPWVKVECIGQELVKMAMDHICLYAYVALDF